MISEHNAIRLECLKMAMDVCRQLDHFTKIGTGKNVGESEQEFAARVLVDIDEVHTLAERFMKPFVIKENEQNGDTNNPTREAQD